GSAAGAAGAEPFGPAAGSVPSPADAAASSDESSSFTGVRMTTGGMGRDPGMLIRIRVVSVVCVSGSSAGLPAPGRSASAPASAPPVVP
ncbi:hypothetical protein DY218_20930, partial [Streptomyces triticagri]